MPYIQAFSGIAKPDINLVVDSGTVSSGSGGVVTETITIPSSGRIQYFNAQCSADPSATADGNTTFTVSRNGIVMSSSVVDHAFFRTNFEMGIMFQDNLSFLAGSIVEQGEVFTFTFTNSSMTGTISHRDILSIGILAQEKQFIV